MTTSTKPSLKKVQQISSQIKTVNQIVKQFKADISQFHEQREHILSDFRTNCKKELSKTILQLETSTSKPIDSLNNLGTAIYPTLSQFDLNLKTLKKQTIQDLLNLNKSLQTQFSTYPNAIKPLVKQSLDNLKHNRFKTGIQAKPSIEQDLSNIINDLPLKETDSDKQIRIFKTKLNEIKLFKTNVIDEKSLLNFFARAEFFIETLKPFLEYMSSDNKKELKKVSTPPAPLSDFSKDIFIYYLNKEKITKITQLIDESTQLEPTTLKNLKSSYGKPFDADSLKRSIQATDGAKKRFKSFKDFIIDDIDSISNIKDDFSDMDTSLMLLNDIKDHLQLGKACLVNDSILMNELYDMDTDSRDDMHDSLHSYINSDEFQDEVIYQQKIIKKNKRNKP